MLGFTAVTHKPRLAWRVMNPALLQYKGTTSKKKPNHHHLPTYMAMHKCVFKRELVPLGLLKALGFQHNVHALNKLNEINVKRLIRQCEQKQEGKWKITSCLIQSILDYFQLWLV